MTVMFQPQAERAGVDASVLRGDEQAWRDSDQAQHLAAELAPVMIWVSGTDGAIRWCNPGCEAFTGLACGSLSARGWLEQIHSEDRERYGGIFAASAQAQQPFSLDYRLRHHDGTYRWVMDHAVPRLADGRLLGYIGSVIDIHERRSLEEQLAERTRALRLAERRQGAFLDMLSHELRNPLAPIANASSVLRTLEDQHPVLPRLREILDRQVDRLGQMVKDLVDATRSAQGHIALISAPVEVETIVDKAVETTREQLERAGHRLQVRICAAGMHIKGDGTRLCQALASILSNASKFTVEPGLITLHVDEHDGHAEFTVTDPGRGISREFLPHVFELFAQEESATGAKPQGLGVGLTLARRIVQLHSGHLTAHSQGAGQGSRFIMSLPLMRDAARPAARGDVPSVCDSYRVLVIESDTSRESLRVQMQAWGNEVRAASTAEDALRTAREFKPHIILCDMATPGLDRVEFLGGLRASLSGRHAVVAAISGYGSQDDEERVLTAGYDSCLAKPLQPGSLVRLLRSYGSSFGRNLAAGVAAPA